MMVAHKILYDIVTHLNHTPIIVHHALTISSLVS